MGRYNPGKIYVNLKEVISDFNYRDFIYFIYNLGMDYYDGLNIINKEEWQRIFNALKENYKLYEIEKKIKYTEFRGNMALVLNEVFFKHKSAPDVMIDAIYSFGKGNKTAKLKYLIMDFNDKDEFAKEIELG